MSSCNRMIEAPGPRQSIWLLGILAVLGNLAVIAWRLIRRDDHPVQTCLLTNLAVSDFLMGVYLMIIAIKDLQWAGNISLTRYFLISMFIIMIYSAIQKITLNWFKPIRPLFRMARPGAFITET